MFHHSQKGIGLERDCGMWSVREAWYAASSAGYVCALNGTVAEGRLEATSEIGGIIWQARGTTMLVFHDEDSNASEFVLVAKILRREAIRVVGGASRCVWPGGGRRFFRGRGPSQIVRESARLII
jgi:hypothetical protein